MKRKEHLAIVIAIFIATFMTSVEVTIVTTAMPTIISQLKGLELQSWVFAIYLLISAIAPHQSMGSWRIIWGGKIFLSLDLFLL